MEILFYFATCNHDTCMKTNAVDETVINENWSDHSERLILQLIITEMEDVINRVIPNVSSGSIVDSERVNKIFHVVRGGGCFICRVAGCSYFFCLLPCCWLSVVVTCDFPKDPRVPSIFNFLILFSIQRQKAPLVLVFFRESELSAHQLCLTGIQIWK